MRILVLALASVLCVPADAAGYYYGSPHGYRDYGYHRYNRYGYPYYYGYDPYISSRLSRERDQLRADRRLQLAQSEELTRQFSQLRDQANFQQQVSAEQACYYRSTGGFEVCQDLFEADSDELAHCEETVRRRNPGCN